MSELRTQPELSRTAVRLVTARIGRGVWPIAIATGLLMSMVATAHDDILKQIAALDAQMAKGGVTGERLLKRAKLNLVHEDWEAALTDYKRAFKLSPELNAAELGMAEAHLGAGELKAGLDRVGKFLKSVPDAPAGILVRARLRAGDGDLDGASADFRVAAHGLENRAGAIYYEWASALRAGGRKHWRKALEAVDAGVAALGANVPLQELGVEIELESGDHPAAIARIDALLAGPLRNSPRLSVLRAETLVAAGKAGEAEAGFRQVIERVRALPARRQRTAAMRDIVTRAERGLAQSRSAPSTGDAGGQ